MLLEIDHITKTYGEDENTKVHALREVSITVQTGDFIAVVGPSGSGKTTLLNIIGGLLLPSTGEIYNREANFKITKDGPSASQRTNYRLNKMGFIFQDYQLIPILTAGENVTLPLFLKGQNTTNEIEKISEKVLDLVGLLPLKNRKPKELSGGQQQRVSIARAIASNPSLILADEPTANLDSKTAQEIINLFKKLNKELNLTFIFSTHDPRLIDQVKSVWKIEDGVLSCESQNNSLKN